MNRFSSCRRTVLPVRGRRNALRLLALAALACTALTASVTSAHAATPDTVFDTVGVNSPDSQPFARFPERVIDVADLTGDGVRDVYASSYLIDVPGAVNAGKVVLVNGATQQIVREIVSPAPQAEAQFGFYISVPGDVNGDGREDLVVGEPYRDVDGNANQGRAYVFSGADGSLLDEIDNPNPQPDEGTFATFGARIGQAGDVTGDGVGDIIIGSPANDVPTFCGFDPAATPPGCRKNEGESFIFDGATRALVRTYRVPEADRQPPECSTTMPAASARCGNLSVSQSPGDVDRDGVADQLVAAYSLKRPFANPEFFGRVYLFSGKTGALLARIDQPVPDSNAFWGLLDLAPNTPGDVTGDGVPDIFLSGFLQDGRNGEPSAGRGWVFDGAATVASGRGQVEFEPKDPTPRPSEAFGFSASRTDYNKDATPDLYLSGLSGQNTETYVFDGRDGSLLKTLALPPSEVQPSAPGNTGTGLGASSRAPGDLNGDGEPDFVATAATQDVNGVQDEGKLFFFLSNVPPLPPGGQPPGGGQPPAGGGCPAGTSAGVRCQPSPSGGGLLITGTAGGDRIVGTAGGDRIVGSSGDDTIRCGDGDDVVFGGPGDDVIRCGDGDDTIRGGTGNDLLAGEAGSDRVGGDAGNDRLSGGSGNDVLNGNSGADRANGGSGNDRIAGGSGGDILAGGSGNDTISGNSGNDRINGNGASDRLFGNGGKDRISGGATGNDRLFGGSGNDRLSGGVGKDVLVAGTGRDQLFGGRGNDRLNTRDRKGGDLASCGENRRDRDRAAVDRGDRVRGCELVRRRA